jgi:cytoskeletal protein RodZ
VDNYSQKKNVKKKKKKEKFLKRHVGLRYFLITFGSCLVIFGSVAGAFIYSITPQDTESDVSSPDVYSSSVLSSGSSSSGAIISSSNVQSSSTAGK